jgi:hypothetical protein
MGNVLLGAPFDGSTGRGITPFFVGGLGLIRSNVDTADDLFESTNNDFAMDLGGGVFGFVNDKWGFRGDIRGYHSFNEPELDFVYSDGNRTIPARSSVDGMQDGIDFMTATRAAARTEI